MCCNLCGKSFSNFEVVFVDTDYKPNIYICNQCLKQRRKMDNVEINVKVNGKEVDLSTISTETFEKVKAASKEKLVYIGAIFEESAWGQIKWMLIYDYAAMGLNLLCIAKESSNYGRTYTSTVLRGDCSKFMKGISEKEIKNHFNYVSHWKLIEEDN